MHVDNTISAVSGRLSVTRETDRLVENLRVRQTIVINKIQIYA